MRHRPALLLTLLALGAGSTAAPTASAQPAPPIAWEPGVPSHQPAGLPDAELFATNNTAVITDPDDPRLDAPLDGFARKVERIIRQGGGEPRATQLLDGVFFSSDLGTTTFERSRDFDVDGVTTQELHDIAERVRTRFDQQSVLTFDYLAPLAPQVDAVEVEVPGVDVVALRDALVADPVAQARLFGGSVTLDGRLLLVADVADFTLVRDFVGRVGGDWEAGVVRFGDREFVG